MVAQPRREVSRLPPRLLLALLPLLGRLGARCAGRYPPPLRAEEAQQSIQLGGFGGALHHSAHSARHALWPIDRSAARDRPGAPADAAGLPVLGPKGLLERGLPPSSSGLTFRSTG